jgi:hypothetical protein
MSDNPDDVEKLKASLVLARAERDAYGASLVKGAQARIVEPERNGLASLSRQFGTATDAQDRVATGLLVGEAAARVDRALVDFVWPGKRTEAHSRIKTAASLGVFLRRVSKLIDASGAGAPALAPKKLVQEYGSTVGDFLSLPPELRDEILGRWDSVTAVCQAWARSFCASRHTGSTSRTRNPCLPWTSCARSCSSWAATAR